MRRKRFWVPLACLVALLGLPPMAAAAGWYARADMAAEWAPQADFSDDDAGATHPPALFGTIPGNDGRPIGAYGDCGAFAALELAFGRSILPWLRADLALAWRPHMVYAGKANFAGVAGEQPVSGTAESLSVLANVFVEIDRLLCFSAGPFRPFVGAGLGVSRNHMGEMTYLFPGLARHKTSIAPAGSRTDLAFMLAAGTGIALTDRLTLELAYRYTNLGKIQTDPGRLAMNHLPAGIDIAGTWARLQVHGFAAGIRCAF